MSPFYTSSPERDHKQCKGERPQVGLKFEVSKGGGFEA